MYDGRERKRSTDVLALQATNPEELLQLRKEVTHEELPDIYQQSWACVFFSTTYIYMEL